MPVSPPADNPPWGFAEWAITGLSTILASVGAFVWRLMLRLETIEASLARQRQDIDATRQSGETALLRLADQLSQLHDEHYRLREAVAIGILQPGKSKKAIFWLEAKSSANS